MFNFKPRYYADIRIEDRFSTAIMFLNGMLQESKKRTEKRAFIRLYNGKMWYYSSTTNIEEVQKKLDELYAVAAPCDDINNNPIVKKFETNKDVIEIFNDNSVRDIPLSAKRDLLQSFLPEFEIDKAIVMPTAIYLDRNSKFTFVSSLGSDLKWDYQSCGIVLSCDMVEGEKKFSAFWQKGSDKIDDLDNCRDELRASFKEQLDYMRNAVPAVPGKYPVILSPEATGIFAHESFGHKSEADFMLSDESMKKEWELGKKVASDLLTITEYGNIKGSGYTPYDDEGTFAKKNYLIKNGKLSGRLHSATTAAILDENLTGNARAVNCTYEPIVRMTNTYIEGGESTFEQLVSGIKKGYFIKTVKHGSGMSTFTIAPSLAYEIVDGKIAGPVQISVISGNVFETLNLIDGISKEVKMMSFVSGGCGKMEQFPLPVGFGGPYVRISEMNVQ